MDTGHVRAEFFRGLQRLGVVGVHRHGDGGDAEFRLCLGAGDDEQMAASVAKAVQMIIAVNMT